MNGFDLDWLSLRAPADAAARDRIMPAIAAALNPVLASTDGGAPRILDIGAGSGANMRYLAPRLTCPGHWALADDDSDLLAAAVATPVDNVVGVRSRRIDLSEELSALSLADYALVTASAFFDLVSASWIDRFVSEMASAKVPAGLFSLTVDGAIDWAPSDPMDAKVADLFAHHMTRDKGFGPGLGPNAWRRLRDGFEAASYSVVEFETPWRIDPGAAALQRALLHGYAGAAAEMEPSNSDAIRDWSVRREALIARAVSRLTVGHRDILVLRRDLPALWRVG